VQYFNGTLYVSRDSTITGLAASATSVNSTTKVTLTATVNNATAYSVCSAPTGVVQFFNGSTQIGTGTLSPVSTGSCTSVATAVASFAVASGQAYTTYDVIAVYVGDTNFLSSTSGGVNVTSGIPTFGVASAANNTLMTVEPGQSGLTSFTIAPAYGYDGTITFSCSGSPSPVTCIFSPASVAAATAASNTLVTVTVNTQAPTSPISYNQRPGIGSGKLPLTLAAIPGLVLLFGFGARRRKFLRKYRSLLLAALCLIGMGLSGCSGGTFTAGTPAGADTITIVATGAGGSFAGVTQQFTVTLTVK
jgi:hypothetical protein